MATLKFYLNSRPDADGMSCVYFRLSISRSCVLRGRTDVKIDIKDWDDVAGRPKKNVRVLSEAYLNAQRRLPMIESHIMAKCAVCNDVTSDMLKAWIVDLDYPEIVESAKSETGNPVFIDVFQMFIDDRMKSNLVTASRIKHYAMAKALWDRFELYTRRRRRVLDMSLTDIESFRSFFFDEHNLFEQRGKKTVPMKKWEYIYHDYRKIYCYASQPRSKNYFSVTVKLLACVWRWAGDNITPLRNIFAKFDKGREVYGTPWYILPEVRNKLYQATLSGELAVQRDIFVFQSLTGMRYSDMSRLTKANIRGNYLEYIAKKTVNETPDTIRVPLHPTAKEIITRYKDNSRNSLLPFISQQKYNDNIKKIFLNVPECDVQVTVLDPKTRTERSAYLHEVASSHMGRRNFIGGLKENGFADEDICSMSGHSEGSKAIARYRTISDDRKRKMIDGL